jgi:hypothetical protein
VTDAAPEFTVLAGNPTASELAAVTAVLTAMAEESDGRRMPVPAPTRNAWSLSQRALRRAIVPGDGAWKRQTL